MAICLVLLTAVASGSFASAQILPDESTEIDLLVSGGSETAIIQLAKAKPRLLNNGFVIKIVAPGIRERDRFADWLKDEFVKANEWILSFHVSDELTLLKERKSE